MNIEEARSKLISFIDFYNKKPKEENRKFKMLQVDNIDIQAIETLLTAYENLKSYNKGTKEALRVAEDLEHQANKEAGDWEARCFELEAELEKEKEKNEKAYIKANNYLYFNDSTDYEVALWEVIRKLRPGLAEKWDNGEDVDLEYIEEE